MAVWLAGLEGFAVQPFTEAFNSNLSSWQPALSGSVTVGWNSGQVRMIFADVSQSFPEFGAYGAVFATNASSSGNFTGNYVNAGIRLVGFRFRATGVLPPTVLLQLTSTNGIVLSKAFNDIVVTTGVWYSLSASLASLDAGPWNGVFTDEAFENALTKIVGVRVRIERPSDFASTFFVDDIFVDGLPQFSTLVPSAAPASADSTWNILRSNLTYTVQSSTNLAGPWSDVASFAATNRLHTVGVPMPTNDATIFHRLQQ